MTLPAAEPQQRNGQPLRCPLCGGERFRRRAYALRTAEDELFKQPWATDELTAYACADCDHVLWFA